MSEITNEGTLKIARKQFREQRSRAAARGIGWELTFEQWWQIWQDSGRYADRGSGRYVMARNWDTGPYAIGNVTVQTSSENVLTYWATRKARRVRAWHKPLEEHSPSVLDELIAEEEAERAA